MITADVLFNEYQNKLDWIKRLNLDDKTAHILKDTVFSMYQTLRMYSDEGNPSFIDSYIPIDTEEEKVTYKDETGNLYESSGILEYRDLKFPVFTDDYGCQDFTIYENSFVPIQGMGGEYDWYYALDRLIDKI